jgi:2-polyprenyl-3-methyl-5-hydroxy-6-metoxy-1,4-benzoquinol methylase
MTTRDLECICGSTDFTLKFLHTAPAPGDKVFFDIDDDYRHEIHVCNRCDHHVAWNSFDTSVMYDGQYVETSYGDKFKVTFEKIINLPPEQSDNVARVANILKFCAYHFDDQEPKSIMDVGSGLCVFLHEMKKHRPDWTLMAVDPDPVQASHARDAVGVQAEQSDFMDLKGQDDAYDVITFNKVLEHVPDPVAMLTKSKSYLKPGGVVYVELPDATRAARHGENRQEFYVEHVCAFSLASIVILAEKSGFTALHAERITDPSGKYSLRCFMHAPSTHGAE